MCQEASFVLTKPKVYWSRFTDSHEEIIKEFGLHADGVANGVNGPSILRVEVRPPNGDMTRPPAEWEFVVDQDIMPEWFDAKRDSDRTRAALIDWIAANVISSSCYLVTEGRVFIVGDAIVEWVSHRATVMRICDNAKVKNICCNAVVRSIHGTAVVNQIHDNAIIEGVFDNANVGSVYGNARINNVYNNAVVNSVRGCATVGIMFDKAKLEQVRGQAIVRQLDDGATVGVLSDYAVINRMSGNSRVEKACGNTKIHDVCDFATVHASESVIVTRLDKSATVTLTGNAVLVDRDRQ